MHSLADACKNFATGILLNIVGTELLPHMLQASGVFKNSRLSIGFLGSMKMLVVFGMVLPNIKGNAEEEGDLIMKKFKFLFLNFPTHTEKTKIAFYFTKF